MSVIYTGTKGPIRVMRQAQLVAGKGWDVREEWHGTKEQVQGVLTAALINAGWSGQFGRKGPYWTLSLTRNEPGLGGDESAFDRWEVKTELLEKDLFTLPDVAAEVELWNSSRGTGIKGYKKLCEQYAEEDDGVTEFPDEGAFPLFYSVALELQRGVTSYDAEYTTVSQERNVSPQWSTPLANGDTSLIYRSEDFVNVFQVPGVVLFDIPDDTAFDNPPQAQWGFRFRTRQVEYNGPSQAQQMREWVFAAWSTLAYSVYVAPI